jgi:hypothetical protein
LLKSIKINSCKQCGCKEFVHSFYTYSEEFFNSVTKELYTEDGDSEEEESWHCSNCGVRIPPEDMKTFYEMVFKYY